MSRELVCLSAAVVALLHNSAVTAQQQCSHVEGQWVANNGIVALFLDASGDGTANPSYCAPNWGVDGTLSNGTYSFVAQNPNGDDDPYFCEEFAIFNGQVVQDACNVIVGEGYHPGGQPMEFSLGKECEVPWGEESTSDGFANDEPWRTAGLFLGTLINDSGSGPNFGGRTVYENPIGVTIDGCWISGMPVAYQVNGLAVGDPWYIDTSNEYDAPDAIGYNEDVVGYMRSMGRAPCYWQVGQDMGIACATFEGFYQVGYQTQYLRYTVNASTVCAKRDGVEQCRVW